MSRSRRAFKIVAVDFDGTCVDHRYPTIGPDVPYAVEVLREISSKGHKLILWTMRSGPYLLDAINWFYRNEIPLYCVNTEPHQHEWTSSQKCYADYYIDDRCVGIRLIRPEGFIEQCIDWKSVREYLKEIL